jgi:E3 ubiquitin-protein ligase UBR7
VEASDPDHTHTHTATQSLSGGVSPPQPDPDTLQGMKRKLVNSCPSSDGPSLKRLRTSGTSLDSSQKACLAPAAHPIAQAIFAQSGAQTLGAGDIFLSGDWRKRWCFCDSCSSELRKHPYLFEEEETYEPPEDPDSSEFQSSIDAGWVNNGTSGLSLEELGLRALERLPRDRALDGIRAFNTMRYAGDDVP